MDTSQHEAFLIRVLITNDDSKSNSNPKNPKQNRTKREQEQQEQQILNLKSSSAVAKLHDAVTNSTMLQNDKQTPRS